MGTRQRLPAISQCPSKDAINDLWTQAKKAPGCMLELPIDSPGREPLVLTLETDARGEKPQWTLYAGQGANRVVWTYMLSDAEMIHEILTLSMASSSTAGVMATPATDAQQTIRQPASSDDKHVLPDKASKPDKAGAFKEPQPAGELNQPNIYLGHILVDAGLIPSPVLDAALTLQEMVRKSALTSGEAIDVLKKTHSMGISVDQAITELKKKQQDKPPATDAVELLHKAGLVSDQDIVKARHVMEHFARAGLNGQQANDIAKSMIDLLKLSGFASDEDIRRASAASSARPPDVCKALLSAGVVDELCFTVAARLVKYIALGTFKQEQAVIALHYSQRCRTGFEETVHSLGWQVPIEH